MKKFYSLFTLILGINALCLSQPVLQASMGPGTLPTSVKIFLKSSATITNANISTLQFNLGILTSVSPKPSAMVIASSIPGVASNQWTIVEINEGGYNNYEIVTAVSPVTMSFTMNVEVLALEVQFTGGPATANSVSMVTLPDGGTTSNTLFLATGDAISQGNNLYYVRAGVTVNNQFSYNEANPGVPPGTGTSTATISGIVLPVNWLDFTAVKQNNDAVLKWSVSEEQINDHYELERSLNGTTFSQVVNVAKSLGTGTKNYSYIDQNITSLRSKVIYYRIKEVDQDSRFSYSDIRTVRLDMNGEIAIHPNPVKKGFYLSIPLTTTTYKKIRLHMVNNAGQIVDSREITVSQAANYYYDIEKPGIISGSYMLRIYNDKDLVDTRKIIVDR